MTCGRVTGRKSTLLCKVATTKSPEKETGISQKKNDADFLPP